jgi:hypothetical protein
MERGREKMPPIGGNLNENLPKDVKKNKEGRSDAGSVHKKSQFLGPPHHEHPITGSLEGDSGNEGNHCSRY